MMAGAGLEKAGYLGGLLERATTRLTGVSTQRELDALGEAARDTEPMARQFLRNNFIASGVGKKTPEQEYKHTGNMIKNVMRARMRFTLRGKKGPRFFLMMPSTGCPDYEDSRTGMRSSFYTVAAALQYGAVRQPHALRETRDLPTGTTQTKLRPIMGAKQARTVKRVALGGRMSKREERALERSVGGLVAMEQRAKSVEMRLGGGRRVTVIRPFNHFDLDAGQRRALLSTVVTRYEKKLEGILGATSE